MTDLRHKNLRLTEPSSLITTELRHHQKQALTFLTNRELHGNGGMLLDDPGCGKTLEMLSLICQRSPDNLYGTTLVVCPPMLIDVWVSEIAKHTRVPEKLIGVYHGHGREIKGKYMIILTSYGTVSAECKKQPDENIFGFKSGSPFRQQFKRIVLDEAHNIKNRNTKSSIACSLLDGKLNWIMTATPIVNDQKDCFSYFRFLNLVEESHEWKSLYPKTYKGMKDLREKMCNISIRRYKKEVIEEFPEKKETIRKLEFNRDEREFYKAYKTYSVKRINKLLEKIKGANNRNARSSFRMNILAMILRLRQCCDNPQIVINSMERLMVDEGGEEPVSIPDATRMLKYYEDNNQIDSDCHMCYDKVADHIADPCGHKGCKSCWEQWRNSDRPSANTCPICSQNVHCIKRVGARPIKRKGNGKDERDSFVMSTKMQAAFNLITEKISKGEKVVVSSQWLVMLDPLEKQFREHFPTVKYIRLDGKMPPRQRFSKVQLFQTDTNVKVCFLSLLSSSEGITLTAANTFINIDPWWNSAKVEQAMDRIYRYGQEKDVSVIHLRIKDSIEDNIQQMIVKKRKIAKTLVGRKWLLKENQDHGWMHNIIKLDS